jgi:mevalonate kinase
MGDMKAKLPSLVTTSAPGSLMLLGEHAVLHGKHALVCAINRRITIRLAPVSNGLVEIVSALGEYQSPLADLAEHPSFKFVLQAIKQHRNRIPSGFELKIDSEFSADIGFGSSAAVTVATHAALMQWIDGADPEREMLFNAALETVHAVQGRGSGADLAASVFGGIVGYSTDPEFYPIPVTLPLTAVYCGYKTPTVEVIQKVETLRKYDPAKYDRIYSEVDLGVQEALVALEENDWMLFGLILDRGQQLMDEMGVNTPELEEIVSALQNDPEICGTKISGSGMGDCAIGIGTAKFSELDYPVYHLETTPIGCEYHE